MDKKTVAIIVTVLACLLCACPGLTGILVGVMFAIVSMIPGANIDIMGSSDPQAALSSGIVMLVVGIVFVIIAAVVIFFAWKKKKNAV
jgi:LPXTG-motif cell wall-anchored protein